MYIKKAISCSIPPFLKQIVDFDLMKIISKISVKCEQIPKEKGLKLYY